MAATSEYPPAEFCRKYGSLLAPEGTLLLPSRAFAAYKGGDAQVREKTQKALKVTLKRLTRLARHCAACGAPTDSTYGAVTGCCDQCGVYCCGSRCAAVVTPHHQLLCTTLRDQLLDQVIECLPSPINLFAFIDFGKSGCPPGELTWNSWFGRQPRLVRALQSAAEVVSAWCDLAGMTPLPSNEEVQHALERVTTGLLTLPLTLVHCLHLLTPRQKTVDIHMVGADLPEVSMTYNGLCRLLSGAGVRCARVILVSPDQHVKAMAAGAPPHRPVEAGPCKVSAWAGLYHHFHAEFIETKKLAPPQLVVCIHPGLHPDEEFASWRPTLELLVREKYATAMTTYNAHEFAATLDRLESLNVRFLEKGENPMRSKHVKQTPADRCLVWSSNAYFISFRGALTEVPTDDDSQSLS